MVVTAAACVGEHRLDVVEQRFRCVHRWHPLLDCQQFLGSEAGDECLEQVSAIVAIQFIQLQRQFETMYDMQAASNVPLAMK